MAAAILSLPLFSCVRQEEAAPVIEKEKEGEVKIELNFGIEGLAGTRVATGADFKSVFEAGDQIGVFACKRLVPGIPMIPLQSASSNYMHNVRYTYDGQDWIQEGGTVYYYPSDGTALDFYAYYPYKAGTNPMNIPYNLSSGHYDLMTARHYEATKFDNTVNLAFRHKLSMIQLEITNRAEFTDIKVELLFVLPAGRMSLSTTNPGDEFASAGNVNQDEVNVRMIEGPAGLFRAYIPPQAPMRGNPLFSIDADNYMFEMFSPTDDPWEGGYAYNYTATLHIET